MGGRFKRIKQTESKCVELSSTVYITHSLDGEVVP
jgi:hypothetical protein